MIIPTPKFILKRTAPVAMLLTVFLVFSATSTEASILAPPMKSAVTETAQKHAFVTPVKMTPSNVRARVKRLIRKLKASTARLQKATADLKRENARLSRQKRKR